MSNLLIEKFPTIKKAVLALAYDNGGINRDEPEIKALQRLSCSLSGWTNSTLNTIESSISSLTDEQLDTLCNGEASEAEVISRTLDPNCDVLLEQIFEAI